MKGKKLLASIAMMAVALCMIFSSNISYAADSAIGVGLRLPNVREASSKGYEIGDKPIWDLISYKATLNGSGAAEITTPLTTTNKKLYCVKAGTEYPKQVTGISGVRGYNQSYNLKEDRTEILAQTTPNYKDVAGTYYNQILWIIDNMYIPGNSTGTEEDAIYSLYKTAYNYALSTGFNKEFGEYELDMYEDFPLTLDEVEMTQQMALWYYTNNDSYYHKTPSELYNLLKFTTDGTNYTTLSTYHANPSSDAEGPIRAQQIEILYNYLINAADASYTPQTGAPVTITTTTPEISKSGDNYLIGPIRVTKNNNLPYTINLSVKNGESAVSSSSFVNANGQTVDINNLTYTENVAEFYVKVPGNLTGSIKIEGNVSYSSSTNATLWTHKTSFVEQPVIEVTRTPGSNPVELEVNIPEDKPFDLALRKFISAIGPNSTFSDGDYLTDTGRADGTYIRAPRVDTTKLAGGTATTATYIHTKEKLKVENGNYIEYTLRIYNEGEIDGYVQEVTDYILNNQGLEFVPSHGVNTAYDWVMYDANGNVTTDVTKAVKIKTAHLSKNVSTSNKLTAYNGGEVPDYKDLKIVFKVTEPNSSANTLVNIAEITDDADGNGATVTDRDSTPGSDKYNYPNNGYNTENHEDDIDYEPVILKSFDLSLRKFISAISSDTTIDESDYLVNDEGDYLRAPKLNGQWRTDEPTTLEKDHPKNALSVKSGNFVLYNLRVYNEGEIDGYASLIRDNIPEGLAYDETVINHPINVNAMWSLQEDGTITTNILAKGNGAELNSVEGDSNYQANLLKAVKLNEDGTVPVSDTAPLNPDYRDVQVLLHVVEPDSSSRVLTNRAQIADDSDAEGNPITDRDSTPDVWIDGEDDQDYEPVKLQTFDLALRKFISAVDGVSPQTSRVPDEVADALADGTETTATYNHTKKPLAVSKGSTITYTLRVYNEGDIDGYASKIIDHLPPYLEFIPKTESEVNNQYEWEISEDGRTATTEYLSADNQKISAREGTLLHFKYVQIECKVKDTAITNQNITNIAEIGEYKDVKKVVVQPDRDSYSDSLTDGRHETGTLPSDEDLPTYKDDQIGQEYVPGQEDDDDFEKVYVPAGEYDLALRKFITKVNDNDVTSRVPEVVTTTPWAHDGGTTTAKNHTKTPLKVATGDIVTYTIRVYNEGTVAGTATEITDYLPDGLEYVDNEFNREQGWTAEGKTIKTTKLINKGETMIDPVDELAEPQAIVHYKDVQIQCKVVATKVDGYNLRNIAEITGDTGDDRDSTPGNVNRDPYNPEAPETGKGQEDDDDFEDLKLGEFDLALRKFITNIDGKEETSRIPQVDASKLASGESTTATYTHPKDALPVKTGSTVVYTIRVYNEGDIAGYASEIEDDIPNYLTFLPDNSVNTTYGWKMYDEQGNETTEISKAKTIKTTYLSKEKGEEGASAQVIDPETGLNINPNLIHAFDKTKPVSDTNPEFKEVKVAFKVNDNAPADNVITNYAQIMKNTDKDGNNIKDRDSTPGKWIEGEDDQDIENIIPAVYKLALLKYVSQVIVTEDGNTTISETGNTGADTDIIPKVEIHKKKINSTTVKFLYTIKVSNIGNIPGNAEEIKDYIPEGMEFIASENPEWKEEGGNVVSTKALENTVIQPKGDATVTILLTWINGSDNMGLKTNVATMGDLKDSADVLLSIKTGQIQTYFILGGAVLIVLASGIVIIRKYVL